MIEREVLDAETNEDGDIVSILGFWDGWHLTRVHKIVAIWQILAQTHRYFVRSPLGEVTVGAVKTGYGFHLRTWPNSVLSDNLDSLPLANGGVLHFSR